MECEPGLKESKAASDEQPLPPGGGLSGRPACSSSLDNPELFQEDSPKKINRPMASRWTDNLAYPKERQERSLREQGPLRQEGAKMRQRETGRGGRRSGAGAGASHHCPATPWVAGRCPCDSDGKGRWEYPEATQI